MGRSIGNSISIAGVMCVILRASVRIIPLCFFHTGIDVLWHANIKIEVQCIHNATSCVYISVSMCVLFTCEHLIDSVLSSVYL